MTKFQEVMESYPTWLEFVWCRLAHGEPKSEHELVMWMDNTHIPADIAEKLGLEPKGYIMEAEQDAIDD